MELQLAISNDNNSSEREMINLPDDELMAFVAEGNERAFEIIVRRNANRLYHLALRMMGSIPDAEDVIQESITKLWQYAPNWKKENGAKLSTWLYRVVYNKSIDHLRKRGALAPDNQPELVDANADAEKKLAKAEDMRAMQKMIRELPERQCAAISLCHFEGLSNADAAEIIGCSVKALESLLVRAKKTLRKQVEV